MAGESLEAKQACCGTSYATVGDGARRVDKEPHRGHGSTDAERLFPAVACFSHADMARAQKKDAAVALMSAGTPLSASDPRAQRILLRRLQQRRGRIKKGRSPHGGRILHAGGRLPLR